MTDTRKPSHPSDHTGCIIIGFAIFALFAVVFGIAIEFLKFIALVKWVFA